MLHCRAGEGMVTCLGGEAATNACFTVANLEAELGMSAPDAGIAVRIRNTLHFECRPDIRKGSFFCDLAGSLDENAAVI